MQHHDGVTGDFRDQGSVVKKTRRRIQKARRAAEKTAERNSYEYLMRHGAWKLNLNMAVCFDHRVELLDGQHRMLAVTGDRMNFKAAS